MNKLWSCPNFVGPVPKLGGEVLFCTRRRWHRGWHECGWARWSPGIGHRWLSRRRWDAWPQPEAP